MSTTAGSVSNDTFGLIDTVLLKEPLPGGFVIYVDDYEPALGTCHAEVGFGTAFVPPADDIRLRRGVKR